MSNDAKFWAARIGSVIFILISLAVLLRSVDEMMKAASGQPANVALWFGLLIFCLLLGIPVAFAHHVYKQRRWDDMTHETQNQAEVEILSQLARDEVHKRHENDSAQGKH